MGAPGTKKRNGIGPIGHLAEGFLRCYLDLCPEEAFAGFEGAAYSDSLRIIDRYVQGVDGPQ